MSTLDLMDEWNWENVDFETFEMHYEGITVHYYIVQMVFAPRWRIESGGG